MTFLNWHPEKDKSITPMEIDLHNQLHARLAQEHNIESLLKNRRLKIFPYIEKKLNVQLHGQILDIGCGSGYASTWLALHRKIEKIYALESSPSAVSDFIPRVLAHFGVENKVTPVLGSFNNIPDKNKFDYIIAFGALHHSGDLLNTVKQCYEALRPGGYLIIQEPALSDYVSNNDYIKRYEAEETFRGITKIRNKERHDHFFRTCEYKTAFHFTGFEIHFFRPKILFDMSVISGIRWFQKSVNRLYCQLASGITQKWPYSDDTKLFSFIAALYKPDTEPEYIPHIWKNLSKSD